MKIDFLEPEVTVTKFGEEDIITTSGQPGDGQHEIAPEPSFPPFGGGEY